MPFFLSTYTNKIDKKNRVSVPANFRDELTSETFKGVVLINSFVNKCIEAYPFSKIKELGERIESCSDDFSETRDALATVVLGESYQLPFDTEGRIVLPQQLITSINLVEGAVFVGKGSKFEIWEPNEFKTYSLKAKELAVNGKSILKNH